MKERILFIAIVLMLSTASFAAEPTTVYSWETRDGAIAFTDTATRVPKMYVADVITIDETVGRITTVLDSSYAEDLTARIAHLREMNAERRVRGALRDCTGHVLVTSQRIQDGDFNRRIYIATDECGRTATVTPFNPNVQINR